MAIRRFTIGLAALIAALALAVPLVQAGTTDRSTPGFEDCCVIVEGYASTSRQVSQGSVDDWFRDRPTVTPTAEGSFNWGDFGIGAAATLGLVLLLAGSAGFIMIRKQGASLGNARVRGSWRGRPASAPRAG
jgi:hypothetical protein